MAGKEEILNEDQNLFEDLDFSMFDTIEEEQKPQETKEVLEEIKSSETQTQVEDIPREDTTSEDEETKEETEETEEETVETEETEENINENSSPLTPYAKLLVEEGILPNFNLEEFDGTADGLKEAMNKEIMTGVDYYKSTLPEGIKNLIDNYEEGVPLSRLLELDQNRFQYSSISEEQLAKDANLQKAVLKDYYKSTTKFSDSKIDKLIQRSEDLDELEEEAKNSLGELVKYQDVLEQEELNLAKENQKRQEEERQNVLNNFKKTLDNTNEIIPGIKVNKNIKDTIYKTMTVPTGFDENGVPYNKITQYKNEHPFEFDIMLSYLYETTKGFQDWSVLSTAGKNKALKSFEDSVKKQNFKQNIGSSPKTATKSSQKDFFDAIEQFKSNF